MAKIVTQFTVSVPNKVGQLAELSRALAEKGLNITGMYAEALADFAFIRLVTNGDETQVRELLESRGHRPHVAKVLQVDMSNKPGQLQELAEKLSKGGVNILYIYGGAGESATGSIFLAVEQF